MDNNIYLQTGVIMLIGLLSKTAILITEFASERRAQGMSIRDAAFAACQERLRSILMTVATMIIGMIPLVIAGGAGANGNRALALGVIGGMAVGTIALLFVVPAFFIVFQKLHERFQGGSVEQPNDVSSVECQKDASGMENIVAVSVVEHIDDISSMESLDDVNNVESLDDK